MMNQSEIMELLQKEPDNYTVQSCCICYGGDSFPGPMREALKAHLAILLAKIRDRSGKDQR